jgi:hypothetical protein
MRRPPLHDLRVPAKNLENEGGGHVAFIMAWHEDEDGDGSDAALGRLAWFHRELCLEPECRRGHGAVYDALNSGEVLIARLRRTLAALPLRRWDNGRIRLACDVSSWLRPDAVRLGPEDDATAVTAAQLRDVVARLIAAGHWRPGDPDILAILDAGYDLGRPAS